MGSALVSVPLAVAAGVVIAAACGLRAFLPLLAVGLAARAGLVDLHPRVAWLGQAHALIALGVATVFEIAADKIPVLDHALDALGTAVRPVAAAIGAFAVLPVLPGPWSPLLALALGGGALGLHALKAKARLGSSVLTLGAANPFLSTLEDGTVLVLVAVALLAPFVALFVLALVISALVRRARGSPALARRPRFG